MENKQIYGTYGITVQHYFEDNDIITDIGLSQSVIDELDRKASISQVDNIENSLTEKIEKLVEIFEYNNQIFQETKNKLEKEIKELRSTIAKLNTRVNNLIAEKQLKEFYEKNNSNKCISSVVEKQHVISH